MTLNKEITEFLKENGLRFRSCRIEQSDVIAVQCSDSEKIILPIEINASTIEEAEAQQKKILDNLLISADGFTHQDYARRPIIITEDLWKRQPEMMRRRLLAHLEIFHSIYARNCEIRRIEKQEAAAFLETNHSYGDASCRYRYGMYLKRYTGHILQQTQNNDSVSSEGGLAPGTLVAVAEFSNARKWLKGDKEIRSYEWTRYASLAGVRICGGMGRMLKHFIAQVNPDDIMSYADIEWSDGAVYRQLGFVQETGKTPVTFRINPDTWERMPVMNSRSASFLFSKDNPGKTAFPLYFRNFGSLKYRLKLTDW